MAYQIFKAQREARKQFATENGEIFAWYKNPQDIKEGTWHMCFNTMEDFEAYRQELARIYKEADMTPAELVAGTEAEFNKAMKAAERAQDRKELNDFKAYVENIIRGEKTKIAMLEAVSPIIRKFDGKVINKRFLDAINDETGFRAYFDGNNFEIVDCNYTGAWNDRPQVKIWNSPDGWAWTTNDRMEADEALAIIEKVKNRCSGRISDLETQPEKFREYLQKAAKVYAMMRELSEYPSDLRAYCRENHLRYNSYNSYIWK